MALMSRPVDFNTTLQVRDTCLCLHVQRAARTLARRFDDALRPIGITNGQFSILMALNQPRPPTMASVTRLLAMNRTTLTAALKPLEREGLVEIEIDAVDRRGRRLALTRKGSNLLACAVPVWRMTHEVIEAGIAGVDPALLRRVLSDLGTTA